MFAVILNEIRLSLNPGLGATSARFSLAKMLARKEFEQTPMESDWIDSGYHFACDKISKHRCPLRVERPHDPMR